MTADPNRNPSIDHAPGHVDADSLAQIARRTSNAVLITDVQARIRWVNDGFTRLSGYTLDDAVGRTPSELLGSGLTDPAVVARLKAAVRDGTQARAEVLYRARDGRHYWLHVDLQPTFDAAGVLTGFMEIGTDITAVKQSEERLSQARDVAASLAAQLEAERTSLAHIVAGSNAGEGEINVCTGELRMSARWAAMLGYALDEIAPLAGAAATSLCHPADLVKAQEALCAPTKSGVPHLEFEYRMRHRDGSWVWLQARGRVSTWRDDGRPEWVSGVNIDVTERRRVTDELRESLALVDALFEAIPIPVVLKDTGFRYQRVNRAYADLFRTDAANLLGKTAFELIDPASAQRHFEEDRRLLETRGSCSYELQEELSGGRRLHALIRKSALIGADGEVIGLVGTAVDISQRIATERAMAEATAAAEAANRAKSAFLATMSHEIRTPMNGVVGMAELLAHSPLDAEQAETVRTIIESANALLGLIDDVLDFSKIEAGRMAIDRADFEITPLVEGVCATLLPLAAARQVRLTVHVDASVSERLHGDALRVRQVLTNLVGNAIKFSAGADARLGRVSVRVERGAEEALRFSVTDNGIGMDEETLSRLFLPFMQAEVSTTRRFGGTGLGLAICRRLVELMGGRIEVRSEPGRGACFAFDLPLPAAAAQPQGPPVLLGGLACVLVPGHELPEAQLRQWLQSAGARVTLADGMAAAQASALALGGPVVIVHAGAQAFQLPAAAPGDDDVRQLMLQYGGRQSLRFVSPSVASVDLLRRDPFIRAVATVAGRMEPEAAPRAAPPLRVARATVPATLDEARAREQLILVAEDDATNRAVLARQLALLGHAAEFTKNGLEALARWRAGGHALLLTDLHMPEMDGYMLAESIRRAERSGGLPRLPIIAVTANALQGESARARASGIDGYLTKPAPLLTLQAVLSAYLPGARTVDVATAVGAASRDGGPLAGEVLNVQTLRELTGAGDAALARLLADFWRSAQQHAADLQAAWLAGDAGGVSAIAHKLKSASRSVGASALAECSARLEAAGLSGPMALSHADRLRFETAFRALGAAVQSHLAGDGT